MVVDGHISLLVSDENAVLFDHSALTLSVFDEYNTDSRTLLTDVYEKLAVAGRARIYYLEGMLYEGCLNSWIPENGTFIFNKTCRLQVRGKVALNELYFTRIDYENQDYYEGTILNGV
jgi:hypothetical protein